jgi:hypothetical protein
MMALTRPIFHISPIYADPVEVFNTLVPVLVHAVDDCKSQRGAEFKKIVPAFRGHRVEEVNGAAGSHAS